MLISSTMPTSTPYGFWNRIVRANLEAEKETMKLAFPPEQSEKLEQF